MVGEDDNCDVCRQMRESALLQEEEEDGEDGNADSRVSLSFYFKFSL